MNAYKISFTSKMKIELNDDTLEPIWDYLWCLYKNGQILKDYELIESKDGYGRLLLCPMMRL